MLNAAPDVSAISSARNSRENLVRFELCLFNFFIIVSFGSSTQLKLLLVSKWEAKPARRVAIIY